MSCFRCAFLLLAWIGFCSSSQAQSGSSSAASLPDYGNLSAELTRVPQTLLGLVHAPEVQQEIGLGQPPSPEFVRQLRELDGPWWRARNLPEADRRAVVAKQEAALFELLGQQLSSSQLARLRQLELQAQGPRILLRPEVIAFLQLSAAQQAEADQLFAESDRLLAEANLPANRGDQAKLNAAQAAQRGELKAVVELLTAEQEQALARLLGERFETEKLSRIYPLAPELIDSKTWVGDRRVTLEELKGQVVLLHFYAFQCHNCQANFAHYNRWQQALAERGVVVVGIQTPELPDERDPAKVSAAALEQGFDFPVLIDLQNANWEAWGNTMWPTVYVIDREGYIRLWWQGELNWQGAKGDQTIEDLVDKLLK